MTTVTLARPERRNAVDGPMAAELARALRDFEAGTTLQAAEQLARDLVGFPQTCMRNDRLSVTQQFGQSETATMGYEIGVGMESLAVDGTGGAARFAGGAGRHGTLPS